MTPCEVISEVGHGQLPVHVTVVVTLDAMSPPKMHSHCVIYELPAGEIESPGHTLHGWFIAGFHWSSAHVEAVAYCARKQATTTAITVWRVSDMVDIIADHAYILGTRDTHKAHTHVCFLVY